MDNHINSCNEINPLSNNGNNRSLPLAGESHNFDSCTWTTVGIAEATIGSSIEPVVNWGLELQNTALPDAGLHFAHKHLGKSA